MKWTVVFCFLGFLLTETSWGQFYRLDAEAHFSGSGSSYRSYLALPMVTTTTGKQIELTDLSMEQVSGDAVTRSQSVDINIRNDGHVRDVSFYKREEQKVLGIWSLANCWVLQSNIPLPDVSSTGCFNVNDVEGITVFNAYCPYIVTITKFDYYPVLSIYNNSGNNILPDEEPIEIRADDNRFPASVYKWQYGIRDSLFLLGRWRYSYRWYDVPASYNNKTSLVINGRQLLGNDIAKHYNKNIFFRIAWECGKATNVVSYTVRKIAPRITGAGYTRETCYRSADAEITVEFDRALEPNERLYIGLNNNMNEDDFRESGTVVINSDRKAVIRRVAAGTYHIALMGVYHTTSNDSVYTYTESASHRWNNFTVQPRAPLTLSVEPSPVHCTNGEDGKIELAVSGGTSPYTATFLKNDSEFGEQTFSSAYTFNNLAAAEYTLKIKDVNGCVNDVTEQPLIRNTTIIQPSATVAVHVVNSEEATGYGRATGWAEVGVTGGTADYSFSWEKQNPLALMPQTSGTETTSRVENLYTDYYLARVEDRNYHLAYPRTEINMRGCFDTVTIFIDQPPELITAVEETHIVTCHGDSDGQLQVHASGGRPFNPFQDNGRTLPYNYEWFKTENNTDNPIGDNDSILSNLRTGYYKVKITDRNVIDTTSLIFRLVQPDTMIAVATALQQVLCDGENTGMAEVAVTGGTPPYTYQWTTAGNDRTAVVENLSRSIYTVFVRDSRYRTEAAHKRCTAEAHVSIKSPDGMAVQADITHPTCSGYTDGSIELSVRGGVPPYRYLWENGNTAEDRNGLANGEYTVTIADANNCHITEKYILTEPAPVTVSLGVNITLCAGQQVSIGNLYGYGQAHDFRWTDGNGDLLSTGAELTVNASGTYKLRAATPEGCMGEDEITVTQSDRTLLADFVISSQIPKDKEIHAVNIMRTEFDSVRWILPEFVTVSEISDDRVSLTFFRTGEYTVGLQAFFGYCQDVLYKTVKILSSSEIPDYNDSEPFLKRFVVFPNPNDGIFSALVELREPADYRLLLYNELGVLLETKEIHDREREETFFNRSDLGSGIYFLRFVSKEHVSVFKIIKQ
jgi:hypothetical protein